MDITTILKEETTKIVEYGSSGSKLSLAEDVKLHFGKLTEGSVYKTYKTVTIECGNDLLDEMKDLYTNLGSVMVNPDNDGFRIIVGKLKSNLNAVNDFTKKRRYRLILFTIKKNGDHVDSTKTIVKEGDGDYETIVPIFEDYVEKNIPNFSHYKNPSIDIDERDDTNYLELAFYQDLSEA